MTCLPGGPFTPPACRKCASSDRYFSEGLCDRCHPGAPLHLGSCRDCLAWGVYRAHNWRCWSCRWWHTHYPLGDCQYCGRHTRVGEAQACRLCIEQARSVQEPGRAIDLPGAQPVWPAAVPGQHALRAAPRPQAPTGRAAIPAERPGSGRSPGARSPLFGMDPDPAVVRERAFDADSDLIRHCSAVVHDHAARHGWSRRQTNDVIRSLRLLQVLQDTPGAKIRATDVPQLPRYDGNITSTLDVLAAAGMLIDDRLSHVERYFAAKTARLPEPMRAQLEIWLEVMLNGSSRPPGSAPGTPRPPASTSWGSPRSSRPGPTPGTVPGRDHPRRGACRAAPKRVPTQLGRVRTAVAVQGAQGPQADLHQPHQWDAQSPP